ncbi:hypothetical protein ElyMa_003455000 [Elysia marginata]|uniref:Uncharacterized protein n=1 Tax=Elysia marginata TaxID=1093978 RepID=A0AAV4E8Z9_9GAST|nr:hypothetical protein ElyMa_003455000 [Elysia marginata]
MKTLKNKDDGKGPTGITVKAAVILALCVSLCLVHSALSTDCVSLSWVCSQRNYITDSTGKPYCCVQGGSTPVQTTLNPFGCRCI